MKFAKILAKIKIKNKPQLNFKIKKIKKKTKCVSCFKP